MAAVKKKITPTKTAQIKLTAEQFIDTLASLQTKPGPDHSKFYKGDGRSGKFLGVRMGNIFSLAKQFMQIPLAEIEKLLDNNYYEVRMGALSIMDFQARDKKIQADRKKELYQLYINRHNRINNWDLVDRSAVYVVGSYLFERSRAPLYKLARSKDIWERRTAIVSTAFFIRQNDTEDTFRIAELLVHDKEELINKAVGSWVREAGKRDRQKLFDFLDRYAATMPRVTLRYAIEKLDKKQKGIYMNAAK